MYTLTYCIMFIKKNTLNFTTEVHSDFNKILLGQLSFNQIIILRLKTLHCCAEIAVILGLLWITFDLVTSHRSIGCLDNPHKHICYAVL